MNKLYIQKARDELTRLLQEEKLTQGQIMKVLEVDHELAEMGRELLF